MPSGQLLKFRIAFVAAVLAPAVMSPVQARTIAPEIALRLDGKIVIAGNRATEPLIRAWVEGFGRRQPAVAITVRTDTRISTDAFDAAIDGSDIDIVPAARELVPDELARLTQKLGGPPLVVPVATGSHSTKSATHALAVYVNASNPLRRISLEQLRRIYGPKGDIVTWGQLGLTGDWAERPVNALSVPISDPNGNPLGITNYLVHRLFGGRAGMRRSIRQIDTTGPGIERHMLSNIVRLVASDPGAIGFSGFAFAKDDVHALQLAETEAGPWFSGTPAEVEARSYPLTRTIYIAVNARADTALRPPLREFLRYVLGEEAQAMLAGGGKAYFPLPAEFAAEQRARIK